MAFMSNNVILCLISSVLSIIVTYLSNRGEENKIGYLSYLKQFIGMFGVTFFVLFLKQSVFNKSDISKINMSGGGYQEHVSIGEPGF